MGYAMQAIVVRVQFRVSGNDDVRKAKILQVSDCTADFDIILKQNDRVWPLWRQLLARLSGKLRQRCSAALLPRRRIYFSRTGKLPLC